MAQVTTLGIDIAKHVVFVHGVDAHGHAVVAKRLTRPKVLPFAAPLPLASLAWKPRAAPMTGHAHLPNWATR